MLHFTSDQFVQWLGIYFWPMLRIMALISTAPILSEKSVPKRVKIGLGMVITIIVAPTLPAVDIPIFSPNAIWIALQQVMIGVAVGFTMPRYERRVNLSVCRWACLSRRSLTRAAI